MSTYKELDKNLIVNAQISEQNIRFYDIRQKPFCIYGLYKPYETDFYHRVPQEIATKISSTFWNLARETSGGRVKFSTDSQYVAIKTVQSNIARNSHFPLVETGGFDLYVDTEGGSKFHRCFMPPYDMQDGYEQIVKFPTREKRYFTINFPIHSQVKDVYVGLEEDASLGEGYKYRDMLPIVIYGSSIVHGTAASRPGQTYPAMLSRRLNMDFLNLGFSGAAKAEVCLAEYMAELPMSMFICDYDHNASNAEALLKTHKRLYDIIREKNPDIPYIIISKCDVETQLMLNPYGRRNVIVDTYREAISAGDKNVYYIDGEGFFRGKYEGDCTVDGVHPNDLGFAHMADGIEAMLLKIINKQAIS